MGRLLPRRFLNLIVSGRSPGIKILRRIDLTRHNLFYSDDGSENPTAAAGGSSASSTAMETTTIRFARPSFTFRSLYKNWKMDCFPLADYSECKLICADQSGRGFVFDLDSPHVSTVPPLRRNLGSPTMAAAAAHISVFVHKPEVDGNWRNDGNGSGLFVMERFPQPEARHGGVTVYDAVQVSQQFVGFINRNADFSGAGKSWHCHLLPPPPFVLETRHWGGGGDDGRRRGPEITAYGVVAGGGGGSQAVCISVEDGVGTYCLDTESLTWSKAGDWTLPFCGKVEYVPELKLWFGLSSGDVGAGRQHLTAADLSGMVLGSCSSESPLRLVGGPWKELVGVPEEWEECKDAQFVRLGSGRFCIARFFSSQEAEAGSGGDEVVHKNFVVLTGVEVNRSSGKGGELELQMTPHKSRLLDNISIETLF